MGAIVVNANAAMGAAQSSPAVIANEDEAVAIARALAPRIKARAKETEASRAVPKETIDELLECGLFGIVAPKIFGGSELGFAALVRANIEIASACGSTGWVYGVLAGHSWLLNMFPVEAQREILANPSTLAATVFRLSATIKPEGEGYRLTEGVGRFCSGVDHAAWVIVGGAVERDAGPPEPRFFIVPRSDIEIVDDWFTVGMRGTGSKTIKIANSFIPGHRSVTVSSMASGDSPGAAFHEGAIYRRPFTVVAPFSIAGAPVGMALGAARLFAEGMKASYANASEAELSFNSPTMMRVGAAAAKIDAAIALLIDAARLLERGEEPLNAESSARIPRDWAYAVQTAREATNDIFEASGGSSIYDKAEIQRFWRDANSGAQHIAFGWDRGMTNFGRVLAGHAPAAFQMKR